MLGPLRQLIHNKSAANSVLLAICYELATTGVVANPRFSCSVRLYLLDYYMWELLIVLITQSKKTMNIEHAIYFKI
jgi:hypothetical protein